MGLPVGVCGTLHVGLLGHTVFLHRALQEEQWLVLQVRRGHQLVEVGLKVSLRVCADNSSQVVKTFPGTEEVAEVVMVAVHQTLLLPVAVQTAYDPRHVLAAEDRGRDCGTRISAIHFHFHNKGVLSKQVKGTSACHFSNKPESKLPAGHHGLTNSPAVSTGHSPGTAIKPDRSKVRQIVKDVANMGPHLHSSFRRGPSPDQAYIHVLANGGHG